MRNRTIPGQGASTKKNSAGALKEADFMLQNNLYLISFFMILLAIFKK